MIRDLLSEFANATADFQTEDVVGVGEDAYGDPIQETGWVSTHSGVSVRYQTSHTTTEHSVFVSNARGDDERIEPMIFIPGDIGQDVDEGDRVVVEFRGETIKKRVTATDFVTAGFDDEGYVRAELSDLGDGSETEG